jgi:D-3-phosphoglycerate dehydrogenase
MARRKVLVTQRFFDDATSAYLSSHGFDVQIYDLPLGKSDADLSHDDLLPHLEDAEGWIVGHAWVTRALLAACPTLRVIARRGVGYERVDLAAAKALGRVVTIATGGNAPSVADFTIGLMIGVGRRLHESHKNMEQGNWSILLGTELFQKTVGIIGLGRIGRLVAKRLQAFDAKILAYAPRPDLEFVQSSGITLTDLPTLLGESDYVTLHAPLTAETRHLINASSLASMKRGSILINTARSDLVDEQALINALKSGHLRGAGLDVLQAETDPTQKSIASELLSMPGVLAAPHAAASTSEGLKRSNMIAARTIVAVFEGRDPDPACVIADGRTAAA